MQDFTGFDSFFMFWDAPHAPTHCGAVFIFDKTKINGSFDFDVFKEFLGSRLHVNKVFRQKLVEIPLNLGRPFWVEDPNFNLDFHLQRMALPKPGGRKELSQLAGNYFSQPLVRTRPLWEVAFIEGLDSYEGAPVGSFALFVKVHHVALDGISCAKVVESLLSTSPEPQSLPESNTRQPEQIPTELDLLLQMAARGATLPFKLAKLLPKTLLSVLNTGAVWGVERIAPPALPFTAPHTRFNVPISNERVFDGIVISLDRIKKIKNAMNVTVNDVVLAICAGGIQRYLKEKRDLPDKPIVALTPVSTQEEWDESEMGNQLSAMLVSLATNENDPVKRIEIIHKNSKSSKTYHRALGSKTLSDFLQVIPFSVANIMTYFYARMKLAKLHSPVFNLVVSNVPGPLDSLYMNGPRMVANFPVGTVCDLYGLFVGVLSYAGTMAIGVTSCRDIMPDVDVFVDHIKESLSELEAAVSKRSKIDLNDNVIYKIKNKPKIGKKEKQTTAKKAEPTTTGKIKLMAVK